MSYRRLTKHGRERFIERIGYVSDQDNFFRFTAKQRVHVRLAEEPEKNH